MLKGIAESLDPKAVRAHARRMQRLSAAVHEVMSAQGMVEKEGCETFCHQEIEIGPDGVPRTKLVCETICP